MVYYTSTLSVECNSQAVLVFVIRRGVRAPFAFFDCERHVISPGLVYREQGRCLGLVYAHVYGGGDAISEDDSSVYVGLSENSTFTENMVHRRLH